MDDIIRTAEEKSECSSADPDIQIENQLREKQIRDEKNRMNGAKNEGFKEGQSLGEHNKAIEVARKMMANGKTIEEIKEYTDLREEEIKKLI